MTPCGKIVDYLRTCYSTKFRFFPGDLTRESDVTWYRPAPGAELLGVYNRFSSSVYSPPMTPASSPQIGEIIGHPRTYYDGAQIGSYPGTGGCTTAAKWLNGSPGPGADFDQDACCAIPDYCNGALLCDLFTDTDGTSLTAHTMNIGPGWSVNVDGGGETWSILSNAAIVDYSLTNLGNAGAVSDAGSADGLMEFDVTIPASGKCQVYGFWRFQDINNHWLLVWNVTTGTNNTTVYKVVGGTFTLKAGINITRPAAGQYRLSVDAHGNNHLVKVAGNTVYSGTDSALNTKTKWGIGQFLYHAQSYDFVAPFDNFRVTP